MQVRDIVPTWPPDGLIVVRTENGMVEMEVDNRDDLVRFQLDQSKAAALLTALQWALRVIEQKEVNDDTNYDNNGSPEDHN